MISVFNFNLNKVGGKWGTNDFWKRKIGK